LLFSTEPVENFVGKTPALAKKACPVSLPASLHAFAALKATQRNQQLSADRREGDDAAQQIAAFSGRDPVVGISQALSAHSPALRHDLRRS
jgi:hypothetical protein